VFLPIGRSSPAHEFGRLAEEGMRVSGGNFTGGFATRTSSSARKFAKITNAELKSKLTDLLSGSKKLPSSEIFSTCEIARPRLTQFLKANPDFIVTTGNKRSTLYSLK
jgi:hypothetical protein